MGDIIPELYGRSIKEIAAICGVDVSTARRWKRGAICLPYTARLLLAGDLGCFDPAWAGWRLQNGKLVSPENWTATPGDVLGIQLTQAQLSTYRAQNRGLKAALEAAEAGAGYSENQPEPGSWTVAIEG